MGSGMQGTDTGCDVWPFRACMYTDVGAGNPISILHQCTLLRAISCQTSSLYHELNAVYVVVKEVFQFGWSCAGVIHEVLQGWQNQSWRFHCPLEGRCTDQHMS